MGKCKLCKKKVADNIEYCAECIDKKELISNESYLDDLLNSMQENATRASDIYKRKKGERDSDSPDTVAPLQEELAYSIDSEDVSDFDQYDILKDLDDDIEIRDEDLYGDVLDPLINDDFLNEQTLENEEDQVSDFDIEQNIDNEFLGVDNTEELDYEEDEYFDPFIDDLLEQLDLSDDDIDSVENEISQSKAEEYDLESNSVDDNEIKENDSEYNSLFENNSVDNDQKDMDLAYDEFSDISEFIEEGLGAVDNIEDETVAGGLESAFQADEITPESELLNLLNQFNPDNPIEDDIQAINELLGGIDSNNKQDKAFPEDVGEVFSEALEAVSGLRGIDTVVNDISSEPDSIEASKGKKEKKRKKEKKLGFFASLLEDEDDEVLTPEKKKAKGKKAQVVDFDGANDTASNDGKLTEAQKEKKRIKEQKRKAKKEKKKIEIIEIEEVEEGHISRLGTSFVFLFFGVLVMLLLIFTNIFSYTLSIKNATNYFNVNKYTQAYNEVYGIELKDEDIELYDKIMTVMYVNKQLNSYNNHYQMKKYPEALDSLLKGLQRYDKYIELATMLGINTDMDYVRNQIVAELYNVFSLTEEEAITLINSETQAQYSIAVYDVVLERILFY